MKKEIVLDSSSLILIAKTGVLDKIIRYLQNITITEQIYNESTLGKDTFDAKIIKKRVEETVIGKKAIKDFAIYQKIKDDFNLGKGEAEAITFCLENNVGLVTDDKKAMNACRILKIKFTTVLNLLIRLHKKDLISDVEFEVYFKKLDKFGRYSNEILQKYKEDLKK